MVLHHWLFLGYPQQSQCVIESPFVHEIVLPDDKLIWGGTNVSALFGSAAPGAIDTDSWAKVFEYRLKLLVDDNINEIRKNRQSIETYAYINKTFNIFVEF